MIKNLVQFKSVIEGEECMFHSDFHFDARCPTTFAKQALFECLKWIGEVEDNVKAQAAAAEPPKPEEKAQEPS